MNFQLLKELTKTFIDTVQGTARQMVIALQKHTYEVRVTNPQKKVEVSGKVTVDNQAAVERQLKTVALALAELKKPLASLKEVRVSNFPQPKEIAFPKPPQFPKEIGITNFPTSMSISNIKLLENALERVEKAIAGIEVAPSVKVDAPVVNVPAPVVNVPSQPAPVVNVPKLDLSGLDAILGFFQELNVKNALPVRLSDGKEFYKAVERIVASGGSRSVSPFATVQGDEARGQVDSKGRLSVVFSKTFELNDSAVSGDTTFMGEETSDGQYKITKIVKTGDNNDLSYATIRNNPLVLDYSSAWGDKEGLEYDKASTSL